MQSIERAFSVLRALAASSDSTGVSEVARATGLPKSTTSRILASLEELGVVDRVSEDGRYAIGAGLATLTADVMPAGSLRELCRPYLIELAEQSGEGTGLAIDDRGETVARVDVPGLHTAVVDDPIDGDLYLVTDRGAVSRFNRQ